jgi:hypothetical protein
VDKNYNFCICCSMNSAERVTSTSIVTQGIPFRMLSGDAPANLPPFHIPSRKLRIMLLMVTYGVPVQKATDGTIGSALCQSDAYEEATPKRQKGVSSG